MPVKIDFEPEAAAIDFEPDSSGIDFEPEQPESGLSAQTLAQLNQDIRLTEGGRQMGAGNDRLLSAVVNSFVRTPPTAQELRQREIEKASGVEPIPLGTRLASGLHTGISQGLATPARLVHGAADLALGAVGAGNTAPARWNADMLKQYADYERRAQAQDVATFGPDDIANQLASGTGRAITELPLYIAPGMGAASPAQAVARSSAAGGIVGGGTQYAQDRGEGRDRIDAATYATASGLITALTTRAFGATGAESVFRTEGIQGIRNRLVAVLKDAGLEGAEEAIDQAQQDILERFTRNPEKPIDATIKEVLMAGAVGGIVGGGVSGVTQGVQVGAGLAQDLLTARDPEQDMLGSPLDNLAHEQAQNRPALDAATAAFNQRRAAETKIDFEPETLSQSQPTESPQNSDSSLVTGKQNPPAAVQATSPVQAASASQVRAELEALPGADQDLRRTVPALTSDQTDAGLREDNTPATKADLIALAQFIEKGGPNPFAKQDKPKLINSEPLPGSVGSRSSTAALPDNEARTAAAAQRTAPAKQMPAGAAVTAEVTDGAPIPANGQEGTTVTPARKPAKAKGTRAMKVFATEEEMGGPDILSFIVNEAGGLVSKSSAKRQRGADWWKLNASLYDDAAKLARPHHNVIYSDSGQYPDQIAQAAYDARVIKEPTVNALWEAVKAASAKRGNAYQVQRQQEQHLETQAKFASATAQGDLAVTAEDLQPGDTFEVDGEPFKVKRVDARTGEVTLDDGKVFGRQYLSAGQQIWVEQPSDGLTERVADADGGAQFAAGDDFFGAPESVEEQKERLRVEKLKVESRKAKESMIERAGARLVADEDTRTVDMFASPEGRSTRQDKAGQGSLFAAGETKRDWRKPYQMMGEFAGDAEYQQLSGGLYAARGDGVTVSLVTAGTGSSYLTLTEENTGETVKVRFADHFAPGGGGFRVNEYGSGRAESPDFNIIKNKIYSFENGKWEQINLAKLRWHLENWLPAKSEKANAASIAESGAAGIKTQLESQGADKSNVAAWQPEKGSALTGGQSQSSPASDKSVSLRSGQRVSNGTPRAQIQNVVTGLQREMPKAAPTTVVNTPEELPAAVQSAAAKQGVRLAGVKGLLLGNRVYLVASNLANPAEAQSIWLHEQVGHFATDAQLGAALRDFMGQVHDSFQGSKLMADVRARYPKADRVTLGREVVARLAEAGDTNPSAFKRLLAMFRAWLRKFGLVRQVSLNDLRVMLQRAAESLREETSNVQRPTSNAATEFAAGPAEQSEFAKLQADISAAEQELMAAIRQTVLPPDQRQGTRAEAFSAKNAAAAKLNRLLVQQLKLMTSANVDAARSPEQTAEMISQTVDLLNQLGDEISTLNARSQAAPEDLTKLRQDLQTRLNMLKGWTDDQTDKAAQGRAERDKPETLESRIRYMEIEGATNPSKLSFPYWYDRFKLGLKKFTSPIPELPMFGDRARFTALFKRGYRLFAVENNRVKKEAAEKVQAVLEPLAKLGRKPTDNDALQRYYRLSEKLANARAAGDTTRIQTLAEQLHELEKTTLNKDPFNLFRRMVLYRDFYWRGTYLKNENGKPITLPGGLTADEVLVQLRKLTKAISEHPDGLAITEALRRHYALMEELRKSIIDHGEIIPESLNNPCYWPHLLSEFYSDNLGRVNPTTEESFRKYLITPVGSDRLIQTDYIKAVLQHTAEVLSHNARADLVAKYWAAYDVSEQLKAQHGDKWDHAYNLPPGYALYAPYKKLPLRATYILPRDVLANQLGVLVNDGDLRTKMAGKVVKVTPEDLRTAMVAGEKIKWALPKEIVDALHGIEKREAALMNQPGHIGAAAGKLVRRGQNIWKKLKLFGPTSFARYSFGNLTTDAIDKVLAGDPKIAGQMRRAARELWNADKGDLSAEYKAAAREGVFETVTAAEVGELEKIPEFKEFLTTGQIRKVAADKVLGAPAALNSFRESVFRYAKFLADVERLRAGEELPFTGMYHKDIDALGAMPNGKKSVLEGDELIYARAGENSLKHFGDYAMLAVNTQWLRRYLMPFVSWTDVNLRYHATLAANMIDAFKPGASDTQRVHALRVSGAKIALTLGLIGLGKELWNQVGGPLLGLWDDDDDLENKLSPADRRRGHIILGKDDKGEVMVIYTPSAWGDVAEWVGGQNFKRLFLEYARGEITLDQWLVDYTKQVFPDFANKLIQSAGPVIKGPYEFMSGKSVFPDFFEQRTIPKSEQWWRFVGTMTDDRIAGWVRGVFDEDYYNPQMADQLQQIILQVRRRDPEQWAFFEVKDKVADWEFEKTGKRFSAGDYTAPEALALRNFRKAIYRGDVVAAERFYNSLLRYGYTSKRLDQSIRNQAPLAGLNEEQREQFLAELSERERKQLELAEAYYARFSALDGREKDLFPKEGDEPAPDPQLLRDIIEGR